VKKKGISQLVDNHLKYVRHRDEAIQHENKSPGQVKVSKFGDL